MNGNTEFLAFVMVVATVVVSYLILGVLRDIRRELRLANAYVEARQLDAEEDEDDRVNAVIQAAVVLPPPAVPKTAP